MPLHVLPTYKNVTSLKGFAPIQTHPAKNENIISRDHNTNNPEKPLMGKRYPRVTDLPNFVFS